MRDRCPQRGHVQLNTVHPATPLYRFLQSIADVLIRQRGLVLLAALTATVVSIPMAEQLELDESIESFFSEDDPILQSYRESKLWFGGDEFLLVAYDDPHPTETDSLNRLREFSRRLNMVPGIQAESTQSLDTLLRPKFGNTFAQRVMARAYARLRQEDILSFGEHIVISSDRRTLGIVLRLLPEEESPVSRRETFQEVRRLAAEHDPPAAVAGEPLQVHDMFRYVQADSTLLGWASSGLLIAVILLLFRSVRWVALPLLVVHATLLWTKAILVLSDMRLSMVSSMLTSLVTIIGIATVTHVTVMFRDRRERESRFEAFRHTFISLAPPVFWTCVTTAIGFAALLSSEINPVRSFGVMMALGTLLVLVASGTILPGGALLGGLDTDPRRTPAEQRLLKSLDQLSHLLDRRPRTVLAVMLVLMSVSGTGLLFLKVETDFSKNFRQESPIIQALDFFESRLGGAGTWEVHFDAPPKITEETLVPIRDVAEALREIELPSGSRLTKVVALSDGIDFAPGTSVSSKLERLDAIQPDFVSSLYNKQAGKTRIVLRALERQPAEVKLALIDQVRQTTQTRFPEARTTGLYVLLANLINSLMQDQLKSFMLAALGIVICMVIAFRNIWLGLVSLLPNLFPILLVIGGTGWIGLPINIGTAMIASVSLGLTVDSSIHYMSGYVQALREGATHAEAIRQTHSHVGRVLILANLALVFGFLVLTLSNFIPLAYFGVLVSLSMLGGLLGNLVLLPVLLQWVPISVDRYPQLKKSESHFLLPPHEREAADS